MKKSLNLILLVILFLVSSGIVYQRLSGANPTQFSQAFITIMLILNGIWILWNVRKDFAPRAMTRMEKN